MGAQTKRTLLKIKEGLSSKRILAWYDPNAETKISADAFAYGLGTVLLQKHENQWKPVVYASRSLTEKLNHATLK